MADVAIWFSFLKSKVLPLDGRNQVEAHEQSKNERERNGINVKRRTAPRRSGSFRHTVSPNELFFSLRL
jgi:hypothetical protein